MGLFKKKKLNEEVIETVKASTIDVSNDKIQFDEKPKQDKSYVSPEIESAVSRLENVYNIGVDCHPNNVARLQFALFNETIEIKILIAEQNQILKQLLEEARK